MKDMLNQVQDMLTVDAIMVAKSDLLTWRPGTDDSHVQQTIRDEEYNQVPVLNEQGQIQGLATVESPDRELPGSSAHHPVSPAWLVSADTSIRRLIDILDREDRHPARFVFQENRIVGMVTFADLNRAVARTALYILLSRLEIELARILRREATDSWAYVDLLSKKRRKRFAELRGKMEAQDVVQDPIEHFSLADIFTAIGKTPEVYQKLGHPSRKKFSAATSGINTLRNSVAHSTRMVVEGVENVEEVNRRCARIEVLLERIVIDEGGGPNVSI